MEVKPADEYKTVFITHNGLFVYNVMPFGLCNSHATFQRLIKRILGPLVGDNILVNLVDVLIFSASFDVLLETLEQVLRYLANAHLKFTPSKCSRFEEINHYLEYVVSIAKISPEQNKLNII